MYISVTPCKIDATLEPADEVQLSPNQTVKFPVLVRTPRPAPINEMK